jgi:excisionase family DNA binding protein
MEALTVKEVAAELRCSYTMALKLMDCEGLPYIRLGSGQRCRRIVRREDLQAWVEKNRMVKKLS